VLYFGNVQIELTNIAQCDIDRVRIIANIEFRQ